VNDKTISVCPVCLQRLKAHLVRRQGSIFLEKTCPEHGFFSTLVWADGLDFDAWGGSAAASCCCGEVADTDASTADCCDMPAQADASAASCCDEVFFASKGAEDCCSGGHPGAGHPIGSHSGQPDCPSGCADCDLHLTRPCCVLFEVTQRCNLNCPVCFAAAGSAPGGFDGGHGGGHGGDDGGGDGGCGGDDGGCGDRGAAPTVPPDPSLATIGSWYDALKQRAGICHIQLSGGEPTLRDDLPQIIRIGRQKGFDYFQLNTNGLRLATDRKLAGQLKDAGLSCVFLQFDGLSEAASRKLRGRPLLAQKKAAIANAAVAGLPVVLVPTLAYGINDHELMAIVDFGIQAAPAVRGIHFQPIAHFGRCELEKHRLDEPLGHCGPDPQFFTPLAMDNVGCSNLQREGEGASTVLCSCDGNIHEPSSCPSATVARLTIPDVLKLLEEQSGGMLRREHFSGGSAESPHCSFSANYLIGEDGRLEHLGARGTTAITAVAAATGGSSAAQQCCSQQPSCCGLPVPTVSEPDSHGLLRSAAIKSGQCDRSGQPDSGAAESLPYGQSDSVALAQDIQKRRWGSPFNGLPPSRPEGNTLDAWLWDSRMRGFAISGMAFMDAYSMDFERLRSCYIFVMDAQGRPIPFCAYNLTNTQGRGFYR